MFKYYRLVYFTSIVFIQADSGLILIRPPTAFNILIVMEINGLVPLDNARLKIQKIQKYLQNHYPETFQDFNCYFYLTSLVLHFYNFPLILIDRFQNILYTFHLVYHL